MSARLAPFWAVTAALASALGGLGCVEPDPLRSEDDAWAVPGVAALVIDTGASLELEPGAGIAVAVEHAGDGRWSVRASCDTALSEVTCRHDVLVSTDEASPITSFEPLELEPGDSVIAPDRFVVAGEFTTAEDLDGFGFVTAPGATVRVSTLLYDPEVDFSFAWSDDPRLISWVGRGAVHRGAPTNPVDLTPSRP